MLEILEPAAGLCPASGDKFMHIWDYCMLWGLERLKNLSSSCVMSLIAFNKRAS